MRDMRVHNAPYTETDGEGRYLVKQVRFDCAGARMVKREHTWMSQGLCQSRIWTNGKAAVLPSEGWGLPSGKTDELDTSKG